MAKYEQSNLDIFGTLELFKIAGELRNFKKEHLKQGEHQKSCICSASGPCARHAFAFQKIDEALVKLTAAIESLGKE